MKLIINDKSIEYTVREIIGEYIPKIKLELTQTIPKDEDYAYAQVLYDGTIYKYHGELSYMGKFKKISIHSDVFNKKIVSGIFSDILKEFTGITLPWGLLTGIRPAKMVRSLYEEKKSFSQIQSIFINDYQTEPYKAELAIEVAKNELSIIKNMDKDAVSIYIGIPFCPTRCLYCSFTSQSIKFSNKLVEPYMDSLIKEIEYVSAYLKKHNKKVETIYIGGGTPTALDEKNLKLLTDTIEKNIDLSNLKEYTVEAGRPDTINEEKLRILKNAKVTRISINPQTMKEDTLKIIGRCHSPSDIEKSFAMAREIGFNHINMDLIAGLPNETFEDFKNSLDRVINLDPESITVHTMSIKHGSYLDMNYSMYTATSQKTVEKMLSYTYARMKETKRNPYYMYRQKNMLGNLENVGYAKNGNECLYNIYIMEEIQSIISLGAGGSTKVICGDSIERVFNVKEVSEYINRIDEMIDRKKKLLERN